MSSRRNSTRGVALVSVLLIVSVATALAYEMASRHALDVVRSRLLFDTSQARQYALGGEAWARQLLYADWEAGTTRAKDTLLEEWSLTGAAGGTADNAPEAIAGFGEDKREGGAHAFEIEQGTLAIRIEDLRARFNLNALLGDKAEENKERFQRLLQHLELAPEIADAWQDWIDADQSVNGHGAEDLDYLLRAPARRAANQPAAHGSELRVVAPLSREEFARLSRHVAALPQPDLLVNVNTASAPVLAALNTKLSLADAERLSVETRDFDTVRDAIVEHAKLSESEAQLAVRSEFYLVRVRAQVGDVVVELASHLHRDPGSGLIRVFSRSFGDPFDWNAVAPETDLEAA